jgi:predicted AlkP superfamily phosphohydrolase/phosphomutase
MGLPLSDDSPDHQEMSNWIMHTSRDKKPCGWAIWLLLPLLVLTEAADSYVGPGAGFGILTSFVVFLNALLLSLLSLLIWPVRILVRLLRRIRLPLKPRARRVVILGLDGFSPRLASELIDRGNLENLAALSREGTMTELRTTCPGISPVAWSSFQTSVNPAKHAIFDFLKIDRERYLPVLSSVKTGVREGRRLLGKLGKGPKKAYARLLRKSKPFWEHLGRYGIKSTVIRVPITYPPETLDGQLLSGMCVPDVRGTQGSYTLLSPGDPGQMTGGKWAQLSQHDRDTWTGDIPGPEGTDGGTAAVPLTLTIGDPSVLEVSGHRMEIRPSELSDWVRITFREGRKKIRAIARFCLYHRDQVPHLYATALNVDPLSPALPISHPVYYSRYLAGIQGPFATLGLAEDTWALSNDVIGEGVFLDQTWSIFEERRSMFLDALGKNKRGLVTCVFDTSDRIQHMFFARGLDEGSPMREMYERMDELIGDTLQRLGKKDVLIVVSDHGFTSFHTCVDFNRWLYEAGFLALQDGVRTVERNFKGVDWSRTRAYSMGLAGIMLNLAGREAQGIVEPGPESESVLDEISSGLLGLRDRDGNPVISRTWKAPDIYKGPYIDEGPDLVVGTHEGFRAGWRCVTGGLGSTVLYENTMHWNGDHCHDHSLVPGIFACNWSLGDDDPAIVDVGPTVLSLLGVAPPEYMEGKVLGLERFRNTGEHLEQT